MLNLKYRINITKESAILAGSIECGEIERPLTQADVASLSAEDRATLAAVKLEEDPRTQTGVLLLDSYTDERLRYHRMNSEPGDTLPQILARRNAIAALATETYRRETAEREARELAVRAEKYAAAGRICSDPASWRHHWGNAFVEVGTSVIVDVGEFAGDCRKAIEPYQIQAERDQAAREAAERAEHARLERALVECYAPESLARYDDGLMSEDELVALATVRLLSLPEGTSTIDVSSAQVRTPSSVESEVYAEWVRARDHAAKVDLTCTLGVVAPASSPDRGRRVAVFSREWAGRTLEVVIPLEPRLEIEDEGEMGDEVGDEVEA